MRIFLTAAVSCFPFVAFAVGGMDDAPPTPTETSTRCQGAQIWDAKTNSCVDSRESSLSDDDRSEVERTPAFLGSIIGARWEGSAYEQIDDPGLRLEVSVTFIEKLANLVR